MINLNIYYQKAYIRFKIEQPNHPCVPHSLKIKVFVFHLPEPLSHDSFLVNLNFLIIPVQDQEHLLIYKQDFVLN